MSEGSGFVEEFVAAAEPGENPAARASAEGAARALLAFGAVRASDETEVRVLNPNRADHGWDSPHTVVEVVSDDRPFLLDSIRAVLVGRGYDVHTVVSLVVTVRRDGSGTLREIATGSRAAPGAPEAFLHFEIDRETGRRALDALHTAVVGVLEDLRLVVDDWAPMRAKALALAVELRSSPPPTVPPDDAAQSAAFLEWLVDDHFTFEGYCEYDLVEIDGDDALRLVPSSPLGVVRRRELSQYARTFSRMRPETRRRAREPWVLTLTRARPHSTVHRAVALDYVGVKRFDPVGRVVGEHRFTGLYTADVFTESTARIPVIRDKVAAVLERSGLRAGSHESRTLVNVLETYPRAELFRLPVDELCALALEIVRMGEQRRARLFVSRDEFGNFVSCLVYLPRDRYTTPVRARIVDTLRRAFAGTGADYTVLVTDSFLARIHVVVTTDDPLVEVDTDALEREVARIARAWTDDLRHALVESRGEEPGIEAARRFASAFPEGYQSDVPASRAVDDIAVLERLEPTDDLQIEIEPDTSESARIKLFRAGPPLVLSDVVPVLENLGVTVVDERPYLVAFADGAPRWIDVFGVRAAPPESPGIAGIDDLGTRARMAEVFRDVVAGAVEDDALNRLVLYAGLSGREVVIVRALARYLRQAGVRFTEEYVSSTLVGNPVAARLLVDVFRSRFDPAGDAVGSPVEVAAELVTELTRVIDAVAALDEDRILRAALAVVRAIVRTNAFQRDAAGALKPWVSFKLDPLALPFLPDPRPHHEIWVYAPTVEGVHLRAGDVARGGVRWSDRREDFRTEVLGLMKAQSAKNSVIVPVGAKGGFVVKAGAPLDAYCTFVRGLLDVTDNRVDGRIEPPPGIVRLDGDDPYLVVAADKGTASYSDTANELAAEYGYWLGDAFASGGSTGYDHKAMGITARGAWVSVRAHFRARGVDADTASLTVVGIGDMSGDVFGNGLLRSRRLKLVAAFDHRHVFVDPDPDPDASFEERRRLFELPGSSWADYDPAVLSTGGTVVARSAKAVSLSPEARRALDVEASALTPDEIVRAILRAPVDLMWSGGVGTFVKATTESHLDVGDRANDDVRVDASELRCRVVAEGGNLGFTQRARVEYALAGGRINTDAIDNSAGVDASDHEVNVKILLRAAIADGTLTPGERIPLLHAMTDDVAALVLADNEAQANALEIASVEAAALVGVHARQIERLELSGHFDRALEGLPSPKELQERHVAGLGLTSPELAVLLAYTKLDLERALVASDVPDDPYLHRALVDYFPPALRERFPAAMDAHPLRREIVATAVANAVVNRAGISFLSRLNDETGAALPLLARAHVVARDAFSVPDLWARIDDLDLVVDASVQDGMFLAVRRLVERAARRLVLREAPLRLGPMVAQYRPGVSELVTALPELLSGSCASRYRQEVQRLVAARVPEALAEQVACSEWTPGSFDLVDVARALGESVVTAGTVHFGLSDRLRLDWLRERVGALPRADRWQTEARAALRDDVHDAHHALTDTVLTTTDRAAAPEDRVDAWIRAHELAVDRYLQVLRDIEAAGVFDLTTLAVARRALRELSVDHG